MIDRATVARIKDAAEIVDVVSDYVHLTRRGSNYMGLCPFHNEKTPSFSVNPRRNFCYCFSCHKGGSPVNFIMEKEGVSYHDALLQLAKKYGIKVEERELTDEERQAATEREGLMIAANRAMEIMQKNLTDTQEGRDVGLTYFYGRGITDEAIRKFNLGYALDSGQDLTPKMIAEGFDAEVLRVLGVAGQGRSGQLYDKFYGRVIFPITNPSGRVVGFGGRDLKGGPAKYINSPDSALYHKNLELYGISQAKAEIVRQDRCYLVEGYMDVISMWQSGIRNVVASSGTALTDGQIGLIHRFTDNITLLYDGDKAGIKAALRGIDMFLSHKMRVSVLLLPDDHDPDSFARSHTPEEFREYIRAHETDIIRFKIETLMSDMGDSAVERARVINDVSRSIACIPDDIQRSVYIGECSRLLNIDEATVARVVDKFRLEILENNKRQRDRERSLRDIPDDTGASAAPAGEESGNKAEEQNLERLERTLSANNQRNRYPLLPLEKEVVTYLVRYGYMQAKVDELLPADVEIDTSSSDAAEEQYEILYTITDLIKDEMEHHGLQFSYPPYVKLFSLLLNHLDEYVDELDKRKVAIEEEIRKLRDDGLNQIAGRVSTLPEIEKEELLLENRLKQKETELINEFSRNYPGVYLASHEDDDLRRIATELFDERYVLSSIFSKNTPESSEDNMTRKVQRALAEWRGELLTLNLNEVQSKLRECDGNDSEKERELLIELHSIMQARSKLAKDCGERIVATR